MALFPVFLSFIVLAGSQGAPPPTGHREESALLADYQRLDNVEGPHVDLALAPIRPLAMDPSSGSLFALNTHDSRLVELDLETGTARRSAPLPWGPTAVALVPADSDGDLVVVCRGSHCLVRLDRATLSVEVLVRLPHEPADLLVPASDGRAFVTCSGARQVVEVDVFTGEVVARTPVAALEPTFLALRWIGGQPQILVAPRASGNNSMADDGPLPLLPGPGGVLDLDDPAVASQGLPDHDLFAIDPGGPAQPVARGMGSVLFALGVQPTTGYVWQLGTEAINKDPLRQGAPALRGVLVENRLAIVALPAHPTSPLRPRRIVQLDDSNPSVPGIQYDPSRSVGQPYALAFDGQGRGYLTGLLTDNITQLSPPGNFVREWDVGSIPRGILVDEAGARAWVHCWGANTVESWDLVSHPPALRFAASLGFDPTPPRRRLGRKLFFSAARSMHNNLACSSCHVEGTSDSLPWDLSGLPYDDKGPLVTQSLIGIEDQLPYHWRGERRDLIDFNPSFDELLGGTPLDESPGGAFEAFRDYVFSLRLPANPRQDPRRVLNASFGYETPGGTHRQADAVAGQRVFFEKPVDNSGSCNDCHTLPSGTKNDVVLDEPGSQDARRNHKVGPPLLGLWRKEPATLETVVLADGSSELRPTLGAALSSAGLKDSVEEFVSLFPLTERETRDVTAFVLQLDSGIAPAVHAAWLLDEETWSTAAARLRNDLLPQAERRNCDIAVFGSLAVGSSWRDSRWFWKREPGRFLAEDSRLAPMTLEAFIVEAAGGRGRFVFLGLPVGMAERFAVDFDEDELFNVDEATLGTDPYDPDTDRDGDPDGHEVRHGGDPLDAGRQGSDASPPSIRNLRLVSVTARVAKFLFETDEPATYFASWGSGSQSETAAGTRLEKTHSMVLRSLQANTSYAVDLAVTDASGNTDTTRLPAFQTMRMSFPNDVVFDNALVTILQNGGGTLQFELSGLVRRKTGHLASGYQLRVDVFVDDVLVESDVGGTTSGPSGAVSIIVTRSGLVPGARVTANLRSLYTSPGGSLRWSMPDNRAEYRRFDLVYTGP